MDNLFNDISIIHTIDIVEELKKFIAVKLKPFSSFKINN